MSEWLIIIGVAVIVIGSIAVFVRGMESINATIKFKKHIPRRESKPRKQLKE
jgi:hypothetical protein